MRKLSGWSVGLLFAFAAMSSAYASGLGPKANRLSNVTLKVLASGLDEKAEPGLLPLAKWFGKPIALLYWKANDAKSETELKAFQALSSLPTYKDKVIFASALKATNDAEQKAAIKRARELKVTVPVILDNNQINSYLEAWFEFPRYGLIDKEGHIRIWHCAHLNETVGPNMTYMGALKLAAEGKAIPTMRGSTKLKSTHILVGQKLPDVGLDGEDLKPTTMSKYLNKRPILVAFWSVTCPHCRQVIPAVGKYWLARKGNLDMVAITRAPSDMLRNMIKDLWKEKGYKWPVPYAPENSTLSYFNIVKVPTVILADKDGIIRYVWIQPDAEWITQAIEAALVKFGLL